jgi:hypothetical protein
MYYLLLNAINSSEEEEEAFKVTGGGCTYRTEQSINHYYIEATFSSLATHPPKKTRTPPHTGNN